MAKNLLIVESPAKAKTIEKYLGSDYQVLSSYGHIRDLPKSGMAIDVEHKFEPDYIIPDDKTKTVNELKRAAKGKTVWLATDEDREGEAISWHLCQALKLDPKTTKRIVFHEITEGAIKNAVAKPRHIDINLVNAQQARRVLDRLVGYELSPVIWKKIGPGLSAGRVQSVAVRLIVEREREIEAFEGKASYKVTGLFHGTTKELFEAELNEKLADEKSTEKFLDTLIKASYKLTSITQKPGKRSPGAPFTTSTLQQAASNRLGYSVRQTMVLAQKLYESGHITYMRTDSLNLSKTAIDQASKVITENYGKEYLKTRVYKTKSAGAQEAHEAIRPTNFALEAAGSDEKQKRLYKLIRTRALASQMSEAMVEKTELKIAISTDDKRYFISKGEVVTFDGFLKVWGKGAEDKILPALQEGEALNAQEISARPVYEKPAPRYTEASLVKKLEAEGIGRPSTYAPTISTIQARGYVEKGNVEGQQRNITVYSLIDNKVSKNEEQETYGEIKNKLIPTDTGKVVSDFLVKYFADVVDYGFTAEVEAEFDKIADGKEQWNRMIADFYGPFHKLVEKSEDISRQDANQGRELGKDPKSGKPVIARLGRFGAMIQIGQAEDEEKPKFAPMPAGKNLSNVTLEEALEMFKLPRVVGTTPDGEEITSNIGRFGPYVKFGSTYVSIKGDDPFTVTEKTARELIAAKVKADKEKIIAEFKSGISVLNGRFGPYITDGTTNAKIPKDVEPKKVTEALAKKLLEERKKSTKKR